MGHPHWGRPRYLPYHGHVPIPSRRSTRTFQYIIRKSDERGVPLASLPSPPL